MTVQELSTVARSALTDLVVRGMIRGPVPVGLSEAVEAGLALVKGPIVMPAPAAAGTVGAWLLVADAEERHALEAAFHRFLPLNRTLRVLCTAWQCLPGGAINDHADVAYDAGVRDSFDDVHDAIAPVLRRAARSTPQFAEQAARLGLALTAFDDGGQQWLASPLCDSYHTVWMQVHQLFLLRLGVTRAEDEALEEQLVSGGAA